jgi:hypothetical protein
VKIAVENSSIQSVQKAESVGSKVNPDAIGLKGSFISSGKVGQWLSYYSKEEYEYWRTRFGSRAIDLDDLVQTNLN